MVKFIFAFIVCLIIPFLSSAQFDYTVSTPYKVVNGEKFYLGKEGVMLAVKRQGKEIFIQKFNSKKPALSTVQSYSDLPKGFVIESVQLFGESCYAYFSVWDKANKKEQLFYREIDFNRGMFKGKEKLIIKVDGKLSAPLMRFTVSRSGRLGFAINFNAKKFGFAFSQDSSKLLIQYKKKPIEKDDSRSYDIIGMYVYSKGMNKDGGKEIKMPYTEKKMDNLDYTVDKEGSPYMIAKVYTNDTRRERAKDNSGKKVANYAVELFKINIESGNVRITPIKLENRLLSKVLLYESAKNEMICAGFYTSHGSSDVNFFSGRMSTDGICLFKLNKDGGVYNKNYYEIPVEIMNQYERKAKQKRNDRKEAKGKAQFEHLTLRNCTVQDDGSIIIIGEQYHYKNVSGDPMKPRYVYYYDDMLITKINPEGKLDWMKKLPKQQYSNSPSKGGMSFSYIQDKENGQHYLMYLDNIKNVELSLDKQPAKHLDGAGGFLTSYKIDDKSGKVSKEPLFDMREIKGDYNVKQFHTGRITHTSDNESLVELYKGKKEDIVIKVNVK
jgi:hypothetical protein